MILSVLRRKSKQSCSLTDELTCHCSLAPFAPEKHLELVNEPDLSEITLFATQNSNKYFLVKGIHEQLTKDCTDAIVPDCQYQLSASLVSEKCRWDHDEVWAHKYIS